MAAHITVVVPCYNAERFIEDTLRSALSQDVDHLTVVVVDDGSSDNSAAVVEALAHTDPRVQLVSQPNGGVAAARNEGIRRLSSETAFVLFLDADDMLRPHALAHLVTALGDRPELVAAFGACSRMDVEGRPTEPAPVGVSVRTVSSKGIRVRINPERIGFFDILAVTPISTPGQCLIRRAALDRAGEFDPTCVPCEDWDMWLRLARLGDLTVVPVDVLRYRDHDASASKNHAKMQRQRAAVFSKHASSGTSDEAALFRRAWFYCMYDFDARLCSTWAREHLARHDVLGASRLMLRAARYALRSVRGRLLGEAPVPPGS